MILYRYKHLPTGKYLFKIFKNIPAALTKSGRIYAEPFSPFVPPVLNMEDGSEDIQTEAKDWEEETIEIKVLARKRLK